MSDGNEIATPGRAIWRLVPYESEGKKITKLILHGTDQVRFMGHGAARETRGAQVVTHEFAFQLHAQTIAEAFEQLTDARVNKEWAAIVAAQNKKIVVPGNGRH